MERFLQDNQSRRFAAGMRDPVLSGSTLSKSKTQEITKARQSREEQSYSATTRRKHGHQSLFTDEDENSEDELRLTNQTASQTRKVSKASQELESGSKAHLPKRKLQTGKVADKAKTETLSSRRAPTKSKAVQKVSDSDEDETNLPKSSQFVNGSRPKVSKRPPVARPKDTVISRKEAKAKPKDIEEIGISEDELGMVKPKALREANVLSGPRPFPMDLTASLQSAREGSRLLSSPLPTTRGSSSAAISSKPSSNTSRSVSDRENASYTQIVKTNNVDPSLLCPFCDQRLPEYPSAMLRKMLKRVKREAKPEPRIGNALGLSASLEVFTPFCLRHEAELKEFPKGKKNGWPTTLDPQLLAKRTRRLRSHLQNLIDNPDEGTFFHPLQKAAREHGKGAVNGAKANWHNFENATAGYYGEQGFAIISQVLFDIFPDIPREKTEPLDVSNYFSVVLVPEAAVLLIQQDLEESTSISDKNALRSRALQVLRNSRKYGEAMFPVLDNDGDNIVDNLARERARKIRKLREDEATSEAAGSSQVSLEIPLEVLSSSDQEGATPVKRRKKEFGDNSTPPREGRTKFQLVPTETPRPTKRKINLQQPQSFFVNTSNGDGAKRTDSYRWLLSD
ncbi:hypothetical protein FRC17_008394 [Serendipita sp. 399]|nr:hypothetical protein FRC17_008394 [Serendipita sp. 399]